MSNGNLVITRKLGQQINIGHDVTITILGVRGNCVRVAICAPREIPVDRAELRQKKIADGTIQQHTPPEAA